MRKIIVISMMSLDGVVQAPGGSGGGPVRRIPVRRLGRAVHR